MFLTYSYLLTAKLSNKTKKTALTIVDYIKTRILGVILSNHSLTYHLGSNLVPRFSQSYRRDGQERTLERGCFRRF